MSKKRKGIPSEPRDLGGGFDVEQASMATLVPMCAGLVGPESENVDFSLVFVCFFEGQRSEEESKTAKNYPSRTVWEGVGGG